MTGHRAEHFDNTPAGTVVWVRRELLRIAEKLRDRYGTRIAISGMATGVDLWWADAALHAGLQLHAYIPFPQQASRWRRPADVREWHRLRGLATEEKVLYDHPDVRHLHARNRAMLKASDACVCVWNPSKRSGGTWQAINDAYRILPGREYGIHVDPVRRKTIALLPNIHG